MKSIQSGEAQRVRSADQGRIDEAGLDHASSRRRTPWRWMRRQRTRPRPGLPAGSAAECNPRPRRSCGWCRIRKLCGSAPLTGIARAVGQFGLQNARGAGADEHPDPARGPSGQPRPARHRGSHLAAGPARPDDCCGNRIFCSCAGRRCASTPGTSPMWVSMFTVSKSQCLSPLRCATRLVSVGATPVPMQLVAVKSASSSGCHRARARQRRAQRDGLQSAQRQCIEQPRQYLQNHRRDRAGCAPHCHHAATKYRPPRSGLAKRREHRIARRRSRYRSRGASSWQGAASGARAPDRETDCAGPPAREKIAGGCPSRERCCLARAKFPSSCRLGPSSEKLCRWRWLWFSIDVSAAHDFLRKIRVAQHAFADAKKSGAGCRGSRAAPAPAA